MTMIETRQPSFPENPSDGFQIKEDLPDGGYVLWTYSEERNAWTYVVVAGHIEGNIYTHQVLTTGNTLLNTLKDANPVDDPIPQFLETQEQVNDFIAGASAKILAKGQRTELNVDFLQNTLDGGYWVHKDREQEAELPGPATFFALTKSGENAENFDDANQFIFNSAGIDSAQQLGYACQGTSLFLADIAEGGYGLYVITGVEQIGSPEGGQFICTFDVVVQRGKAGGPINFNSHCEMKVMSPSPTLVQGEEPFVDDWGYLWYNPGTKELSVSEWHSGETPGSSDVTWTKYSPGGGGGGSVHIGEDPPAEEEGAEWFDTNRLELFVFYMDDEGQGGWLPSSPLGARVEAGEQLQQQLVSRVETLEARNPDAYLKKTGGTLTGTLKMKRTDDVSYWNYIQSDTPNAWHTDNKNHGLILNIGTSNTFKQQFKIQGRSGKDLFEIHDDGHAVASLKGNLNCTDGLKVDGKDVATTEYADETYLKRAGGTSSKMQGILYLGGHKIAGVAEPERSDDAATRGYVDNAVASSGGPSFQTKYDGNRFNIANGLSTTPLENGQVMFLNAQMVATVNPDDVRFIGLPEDEFNWDSCIQSGNVKVNMGSMEAGYYSVFRKKSMSGRNVLLYVAPLWTDNEMKLQPEIGTPCYFHGVFFE